MTGGDTAEGRDFPAQQRAAFEAGRAVGRMLNRIGPAIAGLGKAYAAAMEQARRERAAWAASPAGVARRTMAPIVRRERLRARLDVDLLAAQAYIDLGLPVPPHLRTAAAVLQRPRPTEPNRGTHQ